MSKYHALVVYAESFEPKNYHVWVFEASRTGMKDSGPGGACKLRALRSLQRAPGNGCELQPILWIVGQKGEHRILYRDYIVGPT